MYISVYTYINIVAHSGPITTKDDMVTFCVMKKIIKLMRDFWTC